MSVKVNEEYCNLCQMCIDICPAGAIELIDGKIVIHTEACLDCGACFNNCPQDAMEEEVVTKTQNKI